MVADGGELSQSGKEGRDESGAPFLLLSPEGSVRVAIVAVHYRLHKCGSVRCRAGACRNSAGRGLRELGQCHTSAIPVPVSQKLLLS